MENGNKITSTNANFQALVADDESQVGEVVQAVARCDGDVNDKDLPHTHHALQGAVDRPQTPTNWEPANEEWVTLSVIEGRYVARVLEHTGGNKQAAARVLAVDRKTLDRMIKRHHIDSHHLKARFKVSSQG